MGSPTPRLYLLGPLPSVSTKGFFLRKQDPQAPSLQKDPSQDKASESLYSKPFQVLGFVEAEKRQEGIEVASTSTHSWVAWCKAALA